MVASLRAPLVAADRAENHVGGIAPALINAAMTTACAPRDLRKKLLLVLEHLFPNVHRASLPGMDFSSTARPVRPWCAACSVRCRADPGCRFAGQGYRCGW